MATGTSAPSIYAFQWPGALVEGASPYRYIVPFAYQVIGASVALGTAPAGSAVIFDLYRYANGSTTGASLWPTNNGTAGKPDLRPQVAAGKTDQGINTTPPYPGATIQFPYLSYPDVTAEPSQLFIGDQPANNLEVTPVSVNEVEAGSANWPEALPENVYGSFGQAGDCLVPTVVQVGSTTAGSDATLILWLAIS